MTENNESVPANRKKRPYSSRRVWNRTETRTLLVFVNSRKDEFHHISKKKMVYDHLAEDLTSSGVSEAPFTVDEIRNKLKTLKSAYKSAVDSNNQSGAAPSIAPYMELMEEIYGDGNAAPGSIETLALSVGVGRVKPQTVPIEDDSHIFDSMIEISVPETDEIESSTSPSATTTPGKKRVRVTEKQKLQAEKLEFTEKMIKLKEDNKRKRMMEREERKEKRHAEKKEMHEEKKKWHNELMEILAKKL